MMISAGELAQDLTLPPDFGDGVHIMNADQYPTRREEYWFMRNFFSQLKPSKVIDAGTGFDPGVHIAPYILVGVGHMVEAVDLDPGKDYPLHPMVQRSVADIETLAPFADNSFAHWVSISVIEHMGENGGQRAIDQAYRVIRPGGFALVTADCHNPERLNAMLGLAGFETGTVLSRQGEPLSPWVGYAIGRKPGHSNGQP